MNNYKEIVTKAVIGKTKKYSKDEFEILLEDDVSNVLGCWVINHNFTGHNSNGKVGINGSYDVNIWYSYDNNSKTNVIARNFNYNDTINVKLNNNETLTDANEIIVRSLSAPSTVDVKTEGNSLKIIIEKELGVEIVGDVKLRINVLDDYDDYDEDFIVEDNEIQIDENYLNSVNQK